MYAQPGKSLSDFFSKCLPEKYVYEDYEDVIALGYKRLFDKLDIFVCSVDSSLSKYFNSYVRTFSMYN